MAKFFLDLLVGLFCNIDFCMSVEIVFKIYVYLALSC